MVKIISEDILKRMSDTYEQGNKSITLYTGIMDTSKWTNCGLYPVFEEDLKDISINTEILLTQIGKEKKVKLYSFFLRAEYGLVKKLADRKKTFCGMIKTKNSSYEAVVEVCQSKKYMNQLAKLSEVFQQNEIPWRTPCAPYFYKMFDVYLVGTNLPWYEEILSINIDFEDFDSKIEKKKIPVWNLEKVAVRTDLRPVYEEASQQYHYVISKRRLQDQARYLLADNHIAISSCYMDLGLHFFCHKEVERLWQLYRVETVSTEPMEEVIFQNQIKNMGVCSVRTVGGIYRLVYELGYQERFELKKVEFPAESGVREEVYPISEIWEEFPMNKQRGKKLKLVFKKKIDDYLQTDILSYLVSEVQRQYPDYWCIAEVI